MSTFTDPLLSLHEITLSLLSENDPDILLNTILDQAIEYTRADSGSIALLDDSRKHLEIKVFRGLARDIPDRVKLKLGEGVTGRAILTGKIRNVGNTREDRYYVEVRSDIQSELAVPLKAGSKSFGVISVDSSKLNAFTREHEEYLNILSNYAAQIYTHQETIGHLNHHQFIQELLLQVSGLLGKFTDFTEVFNETTSLLEKEVELKRSALYLFSETHGELVMANSRNYSDDQIEKSHFKSGEGITGKVYSSRDQISIPDISQDKQFLNKSEISRNEGGKVSFFSAPIIVDDMIRGVFNLEIPYTSASHFSDFQFFVGVLSTLFSQSIMIQQLLEQRSREIQEENILLKRQFNEEYLFDNIVGKSSAMERLFKTMKMAADSVSAILITGESGTGKELIATAIHGNSNRKNNKLIKINCAAIPADLLESELFGYERGAFTGADRDHNGKFLDAHKGTIFLDEIGEMDFKLQSKLLRVLQEKEFSPLGSNKVIKVDVRIIAATNAHLEEMVSEKSFREDLFYRLNVIRLEVPPLRNRKEDLPFLAEYLIKKISKNNHKKEKQLTPGAFKALEQYQFPGNIRELENILERAFVLSEKQLIEPEDLVLPDKPVEVSHTDITPASTHIDQNEQAAKGQPGEYNVDQWLQQRIAGSSEGHYYTDIIHEIDRKLIIHFLERTFYNKSKTARLLGLSRVTLNSKLKELNIGAEE